MNETIFWEGAGRYQAYQLSFDNVQYLEIVKDENGSASYNEVPAHAWVRLLPKQFPLLVDPEFQKQIEGREIVECGFDDTLTHFEIAPKK